MATPVLIIGKSGSGKSTSLRNCQNEHWNLIRVLNKPLGNDLAEVDKVIRDYYELGGTDNAETK